MEIKHQYVLLSVIEVVICSEEDDDKLDEVAVVGLLATITVSSVG